MKKFGVNREKYFDTNGRNGITDPDELERYIINIYKTLLTRGIKGTFIYIVDENLRDYFKNTAGLQLKTDKKQNIQESYNRVRKFSPISHKMVKVPLVGSAPC